MSDDRTLLAKVMSKDHVKLFSVFLEDHDGHESQLDIKGIRHSHEVSSGIIGDGLENLMNLPDLDYVLTWECPYWMLWLNSRIDVWDTIEVRVR